MLRIVAHVALIEGKPCVL